MKKTTDELLNTLKSKKNIKDYFSENSGEMVFESLTDMVNYFMKNKNLKKSEVIDRANIERHYGYQILDGSKKPSRDKLIMLCFGLELTLEETQNMLKKCGWGELYPRDARDSVIIFGIFNNKSVVETNILLDDQGQKALE